MKIPLIAVLALVQTGCAAAQSSPECAQLAVTGAPLPAVSHVIDMKVLNDTLLFVYETDGGFGQQFLRRAAIDTLDRELRLSPDMGRRDDGYYMTDMPYPFMACDGTLRVVGRDDCAVYAVERDSALARTGQRLMDEDSAVPFPLSRYVQDVFMTGPGRYAFIGREPKGGRQFAMTADPATATVDTVRQISISHELQSWMPNMGEMACSGPRGRFAFAYRLHPVIEIFDSEGHTIRSVRIGDDTFRPETLAEADFDDMNTLHTIDLTQTPDFIYALHLNCRHADAATTAPTIVRTDWDGNVTRRFDNLPASLKRIAAVSDSRLIGWTGQGFVVISLP